MSTAITINPLATVQEFLRAITGKDWVGLRKVIADDAVWNLPGTSLISGERRGGDAIVARAKQLAEYGVNVRIERFLYGLSDVALLLHNTAQRGEMVLNEHLCNICRVIDGKIVGIDTYVSDIDMLNAFFV